MKEEITMNLSIDGVEVYVEDKGIKGKGLPVVLLHGFPLDHHMWRNQVSALEQSYRVITPDLQGMGQSGVPLDNRSMEHYADDVLAVLDHLQIDRVVLGGFSMGGYVAFSLLRKAPERIAAVILSNTRADADTTEGKKNRMSMASALFDKGSIAAKEAMLPKLLTEQSLKENEALAEQLSKAMLGMNPEGLVHACLAMAFRKDSSKLLTSIKVPTLVIAGERDVIATPEIMNKMAEQIPGALYEEIPGAAHLAPMENPEAYNRVLLDFLQKLH
jgi:3-oxoadipate enol-lactonase